jgi:hypothetical protein
MEMVELQKDPGKRRPGPAAALRMTDDGDAFVIPPPCNDVTVCAGPQPPRRNEAPSCKR